ncbi:hypothetical protein K7432_008461 [Basidiobolus ranarum]|uniref:MARVEL domain-containing protein n=1 Tax=Basidiobolus ranarum TaxID=34480 RepID=A0ABR2WRR5_9FUNG
MSVNPFDKSPYPSPYPPRAISDDSTYPPQNYESEMNPWSANQANFSPTNAYTNTDSMSNPYNSGAPNPYTQGPTYSHQAPTPTQDVHSPSHRAYSGANAYEYKEPANTQHSNTNPQPTVPVPASSLTKKPSVLDGVPKMTTPGSNNPVPLAPLHTNRPPNRWRVLLRFTGLIGSIGAFGFSVGASAYSGRSTPFSDKSAIKFLYIWSAISIVAFTYFLLNMLNRRVRSGAKIPRKWLLIADIVLAICWGFDVVFLIAKNHCPVGKLDGWCDFFNTSIFFAVLTFAVTIISIFWDMYGWYIERKNRLA